ncbi:MAG: hypothetical protein AAFZ65_04665 [Planctomycetota bacterium]
MSTLQHTELIAFVLGAIVFGFVVFERDRIRRAAGSALPIAAFALFVVSWGASIAEPGRDDSPLDLIQHSASAAGALVLALWASRAGRRDGREDAP